MKRFGKILIVLGLLLQFVGCTGQKQPEPEISFEEYTQEFVQYYYSETDFGINFDFEHPEEYGITRGIYEFSGFTKDDYTLYMDALKEEISFLKSFNYKNLTEEEQWTYDLILDYLEREYALKDFFYQDMKMFGSFTGMNSNVPLLMDEFTFNDKQDVDSYINLLKTLKVAYESYLEIELERQEKGFGLPQYAIDGIIEQCDTILATEDYFLENSFNEKIDAVDFLSVEEKEEYKLLNKEHLYGDYYEAFQLLKDGLAVIDATKYNEMGLIHQKDGLDYYRALIKNQIGIDTHPKDLVKYLNNKIYEVIEEYMDMYTVYGDSLFDTYTYLDGVDNVNDAIDYLYEEIQEDFPYVEKSDVDVKEVDDSMKENFSPAAYLVTKYDTPVTSREVILVNGEYSDSSFTTYAHEGYPGHLYQTVYYKSLGLNMVNYLLSNTGYSEGWAVYTEQHSLKYSDLPTEVQEFEVVNNKLYYSVMALAELKVHYEGFTKAEFFTFITDYYGVDRETSDEIYETILELPCYYLYYFMSYLLIDDFKTEMMESYGDSFTDYQFHEFMLNHGNGSLGLIEERLHKLLKEKK